MSKIGDRVCWVARSQVGVMENPAGSNRVKYNTWYYGRSVSGSAYPWCMTNVQWVCDQAGFPLPYRTASCSDLLNWYRRNKPECIVKTPEVGDIIIYSWGHTGIVYDTGVTLVFAVEGNTDRGNDANGGQVQERQRKLTEVSAFIRPWIGVREEETMIDQTKISDELIGEILMRLSERVSDEEIYALMQRGNKYAADLDVPDWAVDEFGEAISAGITDGTRPMATVTRLEAALMSHRSMKKRRE